MRKKSEENWHQLITTIKTKWFPNILVYDDLKYNLQRWIVIFLQLLILQLTLDHNRCRELLYTRNPQARPATKVANRIQLRQLINVLKTNPLKVIESQPRSLQGLVGSLKSTYPSEAVDSPTLELFQKKLESHLSRML